MSGDRTYLESFIESIGSLPSELRRNLNHIRSLDETFAMVVQELRELEHVYLMQAHDIITRMTVSINDHPSLSAKKRKLNPTLRDEKQEERDNEERRLSESKDDVIKESSDDDDEHDHEPVEFWRNPKEGLFDPKSGKIFLPTTEEFREKIHDSNLLLHIAELRQTARQLAEEKIAISEQCYDLVNNNIHRLEMDLEQMEELLKHTGQYETVVFPVIPTVSPDSLAAIQVSPNSTDWILAKVISHDTKAGTFKLSDEDLESNKTFVLPETQVVILGGIDRVSKGEMIYAIYPDTTSFYQATVVQIPKKSASGELFCMVHFKDDGDELGVTHDKPVSMKHVMRYPAVPYG